MREAWLAVVLLTAGLAGCVGTTEDLDANEAPTDAVDASPEGFSQTHVFNGSYETEEPYSLTLEEGPFDVASKEVLAIESEVDGADIQIGLVLPDVPEGTQAPVVVEASPYFQPLQSVDLMEVEPRLTENLVDHGYAVAFVAVRGTADSGGCADLYGPKEQADVSQAVTWLGERDWSNGNVGMFGLSYEGATPWEVAATGNEHLETIVPISGVNDVYQLTWRNGSGEERGAGTLLAFFYGRGFAYENGNPVNGRSPAHAADGAVCPAVARGLAASLDSTATGDRDALGFWEERNHRPAIEENYEGSIFLVHGLQDWNVDPGHAMPWVPDALDEGEDLRVKYWLGQWFHAWPDVDYLDQPVRRVDFAETLLHWFDHELKENTSRDLGPRAQIQDSTGQWRSAETWPPADTTERTFYLAADGQLAEEPGTAEDTVLLTPGDNRLTGFSRPSDDPLDVTSCQGCAVFTSEPLEEEMRFAGSPTFHVDVTPSGPGGHLAAFLYQQEGGELDWLGWTSMDLRFHAGGEQAQVVQPGERITARMQFQPLDAVVEEDASLVLVLAEGKQWDRTSAAPPTPTEIHVGAEASPLVLDTFELEPDQTFASPGE